ncbi:meiosis-specific transcription factor ndt80 [Quaeritorhiza haematococci]|nr:meiosis-specific transcription factor ndt80 [Quaeritorhiza haematococci]
MATSAEEQNVDLQQQEQESTTEQQTGESGDVSQQTSAAVTPQTQAAAQFQYSMPTYAFPQYYYPPAPAAAVAQAAYQTVAQQGAHDQQAYSTVVAAAAAAAAAQEGKELAADGSMQTPGSEVGSPYGTPNAGAGTARRGIRNNTESGPFFRPTEQIVRIFSMDRTRMYQVKLMPRIDRGFFMADNDWTCYRRNYFQVSVSFSCNDTTGQRVDLPCIIELEGRGLRTVMEFQVAILARTSNGSREIELVQHTAKRDKGPQNTPQPKRCDPQDGSGPFGLTRTDSDSYHTVTFERLQFKSATANNGKRRAAQQYHILMIELLARCDDGMVARVATSESAPLVVRGRAPGHYAAMSSRQRAQEAGLPVTDGDDSGTYTPPGGDDGSSAAGSTVAGAAAGYPQAGLAAPAYMGHPAMMQHPGQHIAYQAYQAIPMPQAQPGQDGANGQAAGQQMPAYYHVVQAGQHAYYQPYDPAMWAYYLQHQQQQEKSAQQEGEQQEGQGEQAEGEQAEGEQQQGEQTGEGEQQSEEQQAQHIQQTLTPPPNPDAEASNGETMDDAQAGDLLAGLIESANAEAAGEAEAADRTQQAYGLTPDATPIPSSAASDDSKKRGREDALEGDDMSDGEHSKKKRGRAKKD